MKSLPSRIKLCVLTLCFLLGTNEHANAIPSFSAQTGQPCSSCHIGSFGPQLEPYGMYFKLYGYVAADKANNNTVDDWQQRLSLGLQSSFTNTHKDFAPGYGLDGYGRNDNFSLDQVAAYYGGRITSSLGGIAKLTYDGPNQKFSWDAMDVRHAWTGKILGTDYVGGLTLSNEIGYTSLWNSTPPNTPPYYSSHVAPTPSATNLFDTGLNSQLLGPGIYALWGDWVYTEADVYMPLGHNLNQAVGVPYIDRYVSPIPFWHLALQHRFDGQHQYAQLGTFGAFADRYLSDQKFAGAKPDHVTDIGGEFNYEWLPDQNNDLSFHTSWVHEAMKLNTTYALGNSDRDNDSLNKFKSQITYAFNDTYVPSIQYFKTTGSADVTYWGTLNGSPKSEGFVAELAYVPFGKTGSYGSNWGNMRVALQYTGYTQFDGTSSHASDNNTIFVNLWFELAPLVPIFSPAPSSTK